MRKALVIVLSLLVVLSFAIAAMIYIVDETALPRWLTERSLSRQLGTPVRIGYMAPGWDGRTQLADVGIPIPGTDSWVVHIETVDVGHNFLLGVLVGQLNISAVDAAGIGLHGTGGEPDRTAYSYGYADVSVQITGENGKTLFSIEFEDAQLGRLQTTVTVGGEQVQISDLEGTLLTGTVSGRAAIRTDDWTQSRLALDWQEVDLRRLGEWLPAEAAAWLGTASGHLHIEPADEKHPLEPLAVRAAVTLGEGPFSRVQLDEIHLTGAVGRERILLTDVRLPLLDGIVRGRLRLSKKGTGWFLYSNARFDGIDINRAAGAFSEDAAGIAGRLSGNGYLMTSLSLEDMNGAVDLHLEESNLAGHAVVGTLYNALNLKSGSGPPRGHGHTRLQFSGDDVQIRDFYFYNRGVEILGRGAIRAFRQGPGSPVEGVAVASTRPLKEIDLPGVKTLDKFMFFAQKDAASVRIGGTLGDVQVEIITLPQIREFFNKFLGGGD